MKYLSINYKYTSSLTGQSSYELDTYGISLFSKFPIRYQLLTENPFQVACTAQFPGP